MDTLTCQEEVNSNLCEWLSEPDFKSDRSNVYCQHQNGDISAKILIKHMTSFIFSIITS